LPIDYEIRDFSLKIILLNKNSGLIFSLKHQQTCPMAGLLVRKRDFLIEKFTILLLILQHLIIVISLKLK